MEQGQPLQHRICAHDTRGVAVFEATPSRATLSSSPPTDKGRQAGEATTCERAPMRALLGSRGDTRVAAIADEASLQAQTRRNTGIKNAKSGTNRGAGSVKGDLVEKVKTVAD